MKEIYINNFINLQKILDILISVEDKYCQKLKNDVFLQIVYFFICKEI